jgi:hypothetical protein
MQDDLSTLQCSWIDKELINFKDNINKEMFRGLSPQANYTDLATAAYPRS